MSERAQHLADRARGRAHAFPNASVVDRNARQQKPGVAQLGEVGGDQLSPLLALPAFRCEVRGYRADIFVNLSGFHHQLPAVPSLMLDGPIIEQTSGSRLCRKPDFPLR
jgi:hypothetical protein